MTCIILKLTEDQLAHLDDMIYRGLILPSLLFIKDALKLSLPDCTEFLGNRFSKLRNETPDKFQVDIEKYWDGFHS